MPCSSLASLLIPITMMWTASAVASPRGVHTIPLDRHEVDVTRNGQVVAYKTSYVGRIGVGSPLQTFNVVFDTGSGHVVLPGMDCESPACTAHTRYDQFLSPEAVPINIDKTEILPDEEYDEITVNYGTGQVDGTFVMEHLCIGALKSRVSNGSCVRMGLIQASELSEDPFISFPADGVFGLGLSSLALDPEFSFFSMLAKSGAVPHVGVFLADGEGSELSVGGHNPDRLASPLQWTSVIHDNMGYWQVSLKAVHIDNHTLDICNDGSCRAILDTGTSHLGVPDFSEDLLEELLSVPSGSTDNCKAIEGRRISFEIASFNLTLGPNQYMRTLPLHTDVHSGPESSSINYSTSAFESVTAPFQSNLLSKIFGGSSPVAPDNMWCRPLLMPVTLPETFGPKVFILGEPLLRQYYTVFDGAAPSVGFGLALPQQEVVRKSDDAIIFMQQGVTTNKHRDQVVFFQVIVVSKKKIHLPNKIFKQHKGKAIEQ